MKLVSITFGTIPRLPGLRPSDTAHIDCDKPPEALRDWRISIRGQQAFFISPPGWQRDLNAKVRDAKGAVTVYEIPRAEMFLQWSGDAAEVEGVLQAVKFDSEPFGGRPAPVAADKPILAQIPAGQVGDA